MNTANMIAQTVAASFRITFIDHKGDEHVFQEGKEMTIDERLQCSYWKSATAIRLTTVSEQDDEATIRPPHPFSHCMDPCIDECMPYLGKDRGFPGSDGWIYRNDYSGPWGFWRCVGECKGTAL